MLSPVPVVKINELVKITLGHLGPCGLPWAIVGLPGLLWVPLGSVGPPGPLWAPLGPCGGSWAFVGSPKLCWPLGPLWALLDPCGPPGPLCPPWAFGWLHMGPCGLAWALVSSPRLLWTSLGSCGPPGFHSPAPEGGHRRPRDPQGPPRDHAGGPRDPQGATQGPQAPPRGSNTKVYIKQNRFMCTFKGPTGIPSALEGGHRKPQQRAIVDLIGSSWALLSFCGPPMAHCELSWALVGPLGSGGIPWALGPCGLPWALVGQLRPLWIPLGSCGLPWPLICALGCRYALGMLYIRHRYSHFDIYIYIYMSYLWHIYGVSIAYLCVSRP